ncbi:unnamed protein product [Durusdinium trenchii]|uniref:Uncharacterized protein n=1 Tax=Durusdinium trenchii TaxID=1381693 RepID=A0ABP0HQL3_9DINO
MKLWIAMLSACALAQDFEDAELLAAVEAEDCFSEDCDAAALHLAQLRATYYKEQTETVPKYQYFPSEDLDLDYALQEDSDSAINFVQTSAQYVPNRMAIDATGHVTSPETVQRSLGHSGVISVSADGRVHTEI